MSIPDPPVERPPDAVAMILQIIKEEMKPSEAEIGQIREQLCAQPFVLEWLGEIIRPLRKQRGRDEVERRLKEELVYTHEFQKHDLLQALQMNALLRRVEYLEALVAQLSGQQPAKTQTSPKDSKQRGPIIFGQGNQ